MNTVEMTRESDPRLDFDSWLISASRIFSSQLTGEQKLQFLNHIIRLCSATEIHEFSIGLPDLLYRDFITLLPTELSHMLLSYFDVKTLLTACKVCQQWNYVISANHRLWKQHCLQWGFRIPDERPANALFYKQLFLRNCLVVHRWNQGVLMETVELDGHATRIMALYYYNSRVATGADDRTVRIWCCNTGKCLSVFKTHSISAVKFNDLFLVTASFDRTAASWDVTTGRQLQTYAGHVAAVFCIDFDTQLDILVTGSADGTIKLWSFSKGDLLRTLNSPDGSNELFGLWILGIQVFCDANWNDRYCIFASNENSVFCWAINASRTTILNSEVLFDSVPLLNQLVGWEFDGSFLTVMSQMDQHLPASRMIKETSYEFSETAGNRFVITKSHVFPLSKKFDVYSYLGSGKCFSAFVSGHEEQATVCITRRNTEMPLILVNLPEKFREMTRRKIDKTVTLCDRKWMDGISSDIFGQSFLAVVLCNDSVHLLKFDSNETLIHS